MDDHIVQLPQAFDQTVFAGTHLRGLLVKMLVNDLSGFRKACDARHIVGSGTHAVLLASA